MPREEALPVDRRPRRQRARQAHRGRGVQHKAAGREQHQQIPQQPLRVLQSDAVSDPRRLQAALVAVLCPVLLVRPARPFE